MMDNNYNLLSQINSEADETLAETIWGKPANDIITGINNNSIVPANRSIWELVQNARDVSYEGCKAEIRFIRKDNEFVFEHNGQPFDRKSIQSLIIQTSSKVRNDIVKVGQYGTGFLTTHKFGLRFKLEGALKVVSNQNLYYNFGTDEEEYMAHPTFRVMRQSCSAYSLSLKYLSSLKPYALRFITFILLFIPSTLAVEI